MTLSEEVKDIGTPEIWRLEPLIDVLAYFAAARNYGYVDALTNALDPATALEAMVNAIRDFKSTCIDRRPSSEEAICPTIDLGKLEKSARYFEEVVSSLGGTGDLVLLVRRIALRALARSHKYRPGSGGASEDLA